VAAAKSVANIASNGFGRDGKLLMILRGQCPQLIPAKTQAKLKLKPWFRMPSRTDEMTDEMTKLVMDSPGLYRIWSAARQCVPVVRPFGDRPAAKLPAFPLSSRPSMPSVLI
jgi:hypothetical protein